jgi:hypothetical protein
MSSYGGNQWQYKQAYRMLINNQMLNGVKEKLYTQYHDLCFMQIVPGGNTHNLRQLFS